MASGMPKAGSASAPQIGVPLSSGRHRRRTELPASLPPRCCAGAQPPQYLLPRPQEHQAPARVDLAVLACGISRRVVLRMGGRSCDVYKEAPSKYKCPTCRTPYCSVACFKKHKDESCQKITAQEEIKKSSLQEEVTRSSVLEDGTNCPNDKDQLPSLPPDTTCPAQSPNKPCPTEALEVEDASWLVDRNRLRSLVELNEIRDALKDPELQKMVLQIDGSSEPEKELEKLMEGQAFQQFTNKILDIVSPQQ